MREIKFRAWHTVNKIMFQNKDLSVLAKNIQDCNVWKFMQFTGLKDKNGVDIYEGDILEALYYNHTGKNCKLIQEVYYLEESGCFCVRTVGKEVDPIENDRNNVPLSWTSQPNTIHYLGNIHENPELLN